MGSWLWLSVSVLCGVDGCWETQSVFSVSCPEAYVNYILQWSRNSSGAQGQKCQYGGRGWKLPYSPQFNDLWGGGVVIRCPFVALCDLGSWHKEEKLCLPLNTLCGPGKAKFELALTTSEGNAKKIEVSCSIISL